MKTCTACNGKFDNQSFVYNRGESVSEWCRSCRNLLMRPKGKWIRLPKQDREAFRQRNLIRAEQAKKLDTVPVSTVALIRRMHDKGHSFSAIARGVNLSRQTVTRIAKFETYKEIANA